MKYPPSYLAARSLSMVEDVLSAGELPKGKFAVCSQLELSQNAPLKKCSGSIDTAQNATLEDRRLS